MKTEKQKFIDNAVKILGAERVVECYKTAGSTKAAFEKGSYNNMVKDEIKYEISIA